jgi:phosphate/sulfate permease
MENLAIMLIAATQTWWQILIKFVTTDVLLPVAGTVLVALLVMLVKKWKLNVEKDILDKIIGQAVDYADQKLKKALKDGEKPEDKNATRLKWASDLANQLLKKYGLLGKFGSWIESLIEAKLGENNKKTSG